MPAVLRHAAHRHHGGCSRGPMRADGDHPAVHHHVAAHLRIEWSLRVLPNQYATFTASEILLKSVASMHLWERPCPHKLLLFWDASLLSCTGHSVVQYIGGKGTSACSRTCATIRGQRSKRRAAPERKRQRRAAAHPHGRRPMLLHAHLPRGTIGPVCLRKVGAQVPRRHPCIRCCPFKEAQHIMMPYKLPSASSNKKQSAAAE